VQLFYNHINKSKTSKKIFQTISDVCKLTTTDAYVIGGFVRDLILERPLKDIDILVIGDGVSFAEKFANLLGKSSRLTIFKNFGTANIKYNKTEIEFVGARKESYQRNSRKPIVENGSFEDDINRRDFIINTLAISLRPESFGELTDTYNGLADIQNKVIRTPLDPDKTFSDDPLRMLRAIRFVSQLDFNLAESAFESIKRNSDRISIISQERISDEINKILLTSKPSKGFYLLDETGLLNIILPELTALKGTETVDNKSHKEKRF